MAHRNLYSFSEKCTTETLLQSYSASLRRSAMSSTSFSLSSIPSVSIWATKAAAIPSCYYNINS